MKAETIILSTSRMADWLMKMNQARVEAEKERENIRRNTLGWEDYCKKFNISRPTLIKHRNMGMIPFVMLGAEYRYLIPVKQGGENG